MNELEIEFNLKLQSNFQQVLIHEDKYHQDKARECIKLDTLMLSTHTKLSNANLDLSYFKELLVCELMHWFKNSFFHWTDRPKCSTCNGETFSCGNLSPSAAELKFGARTVEGYKCVACCNEVTRFPRYNCPGKLLETRTGRCGEWANCFLLCLRAIGMDARLVVDWSDHVWNEVFIERLDRWVHLDPCENAWDKPLMYEQGWGKTLTYCVAFSKDDVQDVTWKYCSKHRSTLLHRKQCREPWLVQMIQSMCRQRQSSRQSFGSIDDPMIKRRIKELVEMLQEPVLSVSGNDLQGRTTGSLEWRALRGELGSNKATPSYIISPTEDELKLGVIDIQYDCNADNYLRLHDTVSLLHSLLHSSQNIFRKVEHDWKKVYICRNEGSACDGRISWKFQVPESHVITCLQVAMVTTVYENATVICHAVVESKVDAAGKPQSESETVESASCKKLVVEMESETKNSELFLKTESGTFDITSRTFPVALTNELSRVEGVRNVREVEVVVELKGGKGDVAWQQAQLCRQHLNQTPFYSLHFRLLFE